MADENLDVKLRQFADFRTVFLTSIISALALVVGLFWNEAVKSAIEKIVPQGEGPFYKFLAAIIVTIIVVVIVYLIMHSQKLAEERLQQIRELKTKHSEKMHSRFNGIKRLSLRKQQ